MEATVQKIKVCFIAPKAYPLFNPEIKQVFGGAEVDLYLLATELAKDKGFDVSFIVADYGQDAVETIEGVRVFKSLSFKENPLSGAAKVWRAMKKADAQIYVIKTFSGGVALVAFFCGFHKRRFVYRTAHTNECDGKYLRQHYVNGKLFRWALKRASQVIVQNYDDKKNVRRTIGVDSVVIPNAHHLPQLSDTNRDTVLWVGRSAGFKRPHLFLDLAEQVPGETFTMVCQQATGDNNYGRFVKRAQQVKNLEFIERVPFGEVEKYFARAKILVNTSKTEGFPNIFIQACGCGTPILSLNVNPDRFLDEYACGICCNDDRELFRKSLTKLLESRRYEVLGSNARKYAEEKHDITKIVVLYKKLFTELARSGCRKTAH